ncbi:MAG: hypothetical protein PUF16_05810 [Lachnospiraceae bacterium]|nr:hypothetical protein [Lachnospiraceae bacterium]
MEFFNILKKGVMFVFRALPDSPVQKYLVADTSVIEPKWIRNLNWFFPAGLAIDLFSAVLVAWGVWLAVRWISGIVGLR